MIVIQSKVQVTTKGVSGLYQLYMALTVSPAKILQCIQEPVVAEPADQRVFDYLFQFIGRMMPETSATTIVGKIEEFNPDEEPFSSYMERVELFFLANSVADDRKVPIFLNGVGKKTYGLLRNLVAPDVPKDQTFERIQTALKHHFEPKPNVFTSTNDPRLWASL